MDENDKLKAGELNPDPAVNAVPLNKKAEEADRNAPAKVYSVAEILKDSAKRAFGGQSTRTQCTTGHYRLDEITAGFRPGFVWVFGADTSWGKTSWAISVADENIKAGKRVLIVSAEDPPSLYGDRLMARRARVNADRLRRGTLTNEELSAVDEVQLRAEDVPVYVSAEDKPIEKLTKQLGAIIRGEGIDMIIFDYLQEFVSEGRHQDQRIRFKETSKYMRTIIRSQDKTGIILSQLTISGDTKIPTKHNIRESRDVSNAAEVIAIGFTPAEEVRSKDDSKIQFEAGQKYIMIDKNKDGPPKRFAKMNWNEDSACFDRVFDPATERYNQMESEIGIEDGFYDTM